MLQADQLWLEASKTLNQTKHFICHVFEVFALTEENGLIDICEYVVYVYTYTKQKKKPTLNCDSITLFRVDEILAVNM